MTIALYKIIAPTASDQFTPYHRLWPASNRLSENLPFYSHPNPVLYVFIERQLFKC